MPNVNTFYESIETMTGKKRSMYFPTEVVEWVQERARKNRRSFNAVVVNLLKDEMEKEQPPKP